MLNDNETVVDIIANYYKDQLNDKNYNKFKDELIQLDNLNNKEILNISIDKYKIGDMEYFEKVIKKENEFNKQVDELAKKYNLKRK